MARLGIRRTLPLLLALAGCAAFEGPQPSETEHTVCYTRLSTSAEQLVATARQACGGTEPHFSRQGLDFSACPLLVPERAHFTCSAA